MSNRRNRERRPGRRPPFRDPRPLILVVCEGERTEKEYIEGFARACRKAPVRVKVAPEHGVPRTVVKIARQYKKEAEAAGRKDSFLAYDSVWCVFDVDEHPHLDDARQMARGNGIELAISNPCFELWLLLHFRESPGMQHREAIQAMLSGHVAGYAKGSNSPGTPRDTARRRGVPSGWTGRRRRKRTPGAIRPRAFTA